MVSSGGPYISWFVMLVISIMLAASCSHQESSNSARARTERGNHPPEVSKMTKDSAPAVSTSDIRLEENIPTHVMDKRVVVFNILNQAYTDRHGNTKTGAAGTVSVLDEKGDTVAGVGSRVRIAGKAYDVVEVDPGQPTGGGFVVLRPVAK